MKFILLFTLLLGWMGEHGAPPLEKNTDTAFFRGQDSAIPAASQNYVSGREDMANLPADPLQRQAYRAVVLREWPDMPQWKFVAYQIVLAKNIVAQGRARRTTYCPSCSGMRCADGSRVRQGVCAASRNIPMHSLIWLSTDGLLKVTDRGGLVRVDRSSRRYGENAHFDVWKPHCVGGCYSGPGTKRGVPWAFIAHWD